LFSKENILSPSYNKWAKDPAKAEAYVKQTLGQLLAIKSDGMIPSIRDAINDDITGIMLFIPRTTATSNDRVMNTIIAQIKEVANAGYHIIEITGRTTDGEKAEDYTIDQIKIAKAKDKIPLIVSAGHIGSRSFSIPEINVVILMYDGGSAATTGQNMSRGSTRGERTDKIAHIISISVDPTREDSMVQAVLETASKISEETKEDIIEATKRVLRSMNLHVMDEYGEMVLVNPDDYTAKIMNSRSLRKVVGATSQPEMIMDDPEAIQQLLGMMGKKVSLGKATSIGKIGKTFAPNSEGKVKLKNKNDSEEKEAITLYNKIKEAVRLIADNAENIAAIANNDKFTAALDTIIDDGSLTDLFYRSFNIEPWFVKQLVETKTINGKYLDLVVYTYAKEMQNQANNMIGKFI
jgi:flagellar hook assembly protein FlgD